ncbi:MAG: DUF4189 domain-containing protein [Pirellulales bacterium]|nr:DUF4189 domain-containing protein [Pirellulales bacterium]
MPRLAHARFLSAAAAMVVASLGHSQSVAQDGYYAGIAYSQSTGKIGYTVRQARTEADAQRLAAGNCRAPDAKTYIWGPNQWVAIAIVDGRVGTAGFARGDTSDAAQSKALVECKKRARGAACRVALCIHSSGMRPRELRSLPADPTAPPPVPPSPDSGFYAAIAFSPSTGKIGHSEGVARTKEEAARLALKNCPVRDARVFMWGNKWVAVAVCDARRGVAGFGPGATREVAEKSALDQCRKLSRGAPCRIALAVHSSGAQQAEEGKTKADGSGSDESGSRRDGASPQPVPQAPPPAEPVVN